MLAYFNISVKITINDKITIKHCKSLKIYQSVQSITSTARIELPREFYQSVNSVGKNVDFTRKNVLEFIKIGVPIKIELGYNGDLQTEFNGYITKIDTETPLILECEDEMYQLKNGMHSKKLTKHIKSGNLKDILTAIIPQKYAVKLNESYNLGTWTIDNATPYQVLEELREKVGIRAFFSDPKTLNVGMTIDFKPQKSHNYNFNTNVRASSELKFERSESKTLKVVIKSKQLNGKELSYSTDDTTGDELTLSIPNLSQEQMKLWAQKIHQSHTADGFAGTISGWCYPRTKAGESLKITRPYYSDKHQDGTYFIETVEIELSKSNGLVRKNRITHKLN